MMCKPYGDIMQTQILLSFLNAVSVIVLFFVLQYILVIFESRRSLGGSVLIYQTKSLGSYSRSGIKPKYKKKIFLLIDFLWQKL